MPAPFRAMRSRWHAAWRALLVMAALLLQWPCATGAGNPPLPGAYRPDSRHPRVFTTRAALDDLARRTNAAGSFSAENFTRLAAQVRTDLASKVDWDAAYTGCDLDTYLHAFSFEPRGGYASEIRTEAQLRTAMNVRAGAESPAGAAIVAARLALYAALVKAGAKTADAPPAEQAAALSRRILLAWATRGFRGADGKPFQSPTQFCGADGKPDELDAGLQIGRGVVQSVHAQDLLQSLGTLGAPEAAQLDAFHASLFELLRQAANLRYAHPYAACERYSNHAGVVLTGLLAIARLQDDRRQVEAVLYGADRTLPVALPWAEYFNHAIYGEADTPVACYPNRGPDALTSTPSFQTATVAPGEVEDRYRNANPSQGIGYPMFALDALISAAEILRNAGLDAYGYRGAHRQSIESAVRYYACYARTPGFRQVVTEENARGCANHAQYIGKKVDAVDIAVLAGAARFPRDADITSLDAAAKKARLAAYDLDPIRFGVWTD